MKVVEITSEHVGRGSTMLNAETSERYALFTRAVTVEQIVGRTFHRFTVQYIGTGDVKVRRPGLYRVRRRHTDASGHSHEYEEFYLVEPMTLHKARIDMTSAAARATAMELTPWKGHGMLSTESFAWLLECAMTPQPVDGDFNCECAAPWLERKYVQLADGGEVYAITAHGRATVAFIKRLLSGGSIEVNLQTDESFMLGQVLVKREPTLIKDACRLSFSFIPDAAP